MFDTRLLTNKRPYFAAYVKPGDLPRVTDRLELLQDEWGYLLLWATLAIACVAALSLVLIPLVFGWRTIFSHNPGKFRTIVYFACLGAGYIMVEVGLISDFMLALSNATVSASVLITGMLVFSGLGAFASERYLDRVRNVMPKIFVAIGVLLIGYGLFLDRVLDLIGTLPYALRLVCCFALDLPAGVPDGLPDADGDDLAGAAGQGPHVPVGVGHQRVLLRHRRGRGSHHRDVVRSQCRADDRRRRVSRGIPAFFAVLLPSATRLRRRRRRRCPLDGWPCAHSGIPPRLRNRTTRARRLAAARLHDRDVRSRAQTRARALAVAKTALVPFEVSPFPYRGEVPEKDQAVPRRARGRPARPLFRARRGTYWEDETYSDQRVLLHIPKGFDPRRPALMVVFFHGNEATLTRDVRNRQQVPRQVAESGLNAVLVAPQFAVNALNSSAGRFWEPGVFAQFFNEAGEQPDAALRRRARARRVPRRAGRDRGL